MKLQFSKLQAPQTLIKATILLPFSIWVKINRWSNMILSLLSVVHYQIDQCIRKMAQIEHQYRHLIGHPIYRAQAEGKAQPMETVPWSRYLNLSHCRPRGSWAGRWPPPWAGPWPPPWAGPWPARIFRGGSSTCACVWCKKSKRRRLFISFLSPGYR
jgi:hypothetical protein